MFDRFDHVEPDEGPKPVACGFRLAFSNVDRHLETISLFTDYAGRNSPEGLDVVVDLIEEVFDDYRIVLFCEFVPFVEARRRMTATTFAIGMSGFGECLGFLRKEVVEVGLSIVEELVNRMWCFDAAANARDTKASLCSIEFV